MDKEEVKYREDLKLESKQKIFIPDDISDEKREELNMLNDDPYGHFLKYVIPFMTKEEKEEAQKITIFDCLTEDYEKE